MTILYNGKTLSDEQYKELIQSAKRAGRDFAGVCEQGKEANENRATVQDGFKNWRDIVEESNGRCL